MKPCDAWAHPNIALAKYWGKQDAAENIPATPSMSITLSNLTTRTSVRVDERDTFKINEREVRDDKVLAWLRRIRSSLGLPPIAIESSSNFPSNCGLASSAAGFAALITALNSKLNLGLSTAERSIWARRGSASAARSIYGGFVSLAATGDEWIAEEVAPATDWPLEVVVAITSIDEKRISSTRGMRKSAATSPHYKSWLSQAPVDYKDCCDAVARRDFQKLARVSESSCQQMHRVMQSTTPPLIYWNAGTLAAVDAVAELRSDGIPVFYTIDAGPQVKAVCEQGYGSQVAEKLDALPLVLRTIQCGLGEGARASDHVC